MESIYLVTGHTGEYDDYSTWAVKAFASEQKAKEFVDIINKWCKENEGDRDAKCPYDIFHHEDCLTGTEYHWEEVEFIENPVF